MMGCIWLSGDVGREPWMDKQLLLLHPAGCCLEPPLNPDRRRYCRKSKHRETNIGRNKDTSSIWRTITAPTAQSICLALCFTLASCCLPPQANHKWQAAHRSKTLDIVQKFRPLHPQEPSDTSHQHLLLQCLSDEEPKEKHAPSRQTVIFLESKSAT